MMQELHELMANLAECLPDDEKIQLRIKLAKFFMEANKDEDLKLYSLRKESLDASIEFNDSLDKARLLEKKVDRASHALDQYILIKSAEGKPN